MSYIKKESLTANNSNGQTTSAHTKNGQKTAPERDVSLQRIADFQRTIELEKREIADKIDKLSIGDCMGTIEELGVIISRVECDSTVSYFWRIGELIELFAKLSANKYTIEMAKKEIELAENLIGID